MRRRGHRQRSSRPVKFTVHVVDEAGVMRQPSSDVEAADVGSTSADIAVDREITAEKRGRGRPPVPTTEAKHRDIGKFVRIVQGISPATTNREIFDFIRRYVEASDALIYSILENFEDDGTNLDLDITSRAHGWLLEFFIDAGRPPSRFELKPGERLPDFVKMLITEKVVLEHGREFQLKKGERYAVKTPLMRSYVLVGLRLGWLEPCRFTTGMNYLE